MTLVSVDSVARMIDHAILKPQFTRDDVIREIELANEYNVFSVCVRPSDVAFSVDYLNDLDSNVQVGTVIGFPHGVTSTQAKVAEVRQALLDGATEFDMVLNIGQLKSGMLAEVTEDIQAVVDAAEGRIVKVIFENDLLTTDEKVAACECSVNAGVDFVKTSTGFSSGGAEREDLELMIDKVFGFADVKASGGIRDLDTLLAFMELGVSRFGTSAAKVILDDLASRLGGSGATGMVDSASY